MVMMIYNFVGGPNIASSSGSSNCALGFSTPPPLLSQSPPPLSRSGASNEPNCAITALAATSHWFQSLTDMSLPCRNLTASCEWTMLLRTEPIVSRPVPSRAKHRRLANCHITRAGARSLLYCARKQSSSGMRGMAFFALLDWKSSLATMQQLAGRIYPSLQSNSCFLRAFIGVSRKRKRFFTSVQGQGV